MNIQFLLWKNIHSRSLKVKDKLPEKNMKKTAQELKYEIIDILRHEENNKGIVKYRYINGVY